MKYAWRSPIMRQRSVWSWLTIAYWKIAYALQGFTYRPIAGGASVTDLNVTTATQLANAIPTKWDVELRADADRMTFFGPNFEGSEGSGKPIIRKDDFTIEPGQTINIQTTSPLGQSGVTGDSTLAGNEELMTLGQFTVTPDWVRHAVAFNRRATRRVVFDSAKVAQRLLAKWLAKKIDDDTFKQIIVTTTSQTILQAGNVASAASLGSSNVFTPDEIDRCKLKLQSLGALPFDVMMDNGQERAFYGAVISEVSEYHLKSNAIWNQTQRDAGLRGEKNKVFTGALGMYNGVVLYTLPTIQVSTKKWGTYMKPEARLNGSHTAAVTTLTVGGSNANINYTEYFPSTGNVLIDTEIIAYTSTTNSTIAGATRAAQGTTAATHADGALVSLASNSVERERVIAFGAEMLVRGWSVLPANQNEIQDYRFKFGIGIEASYAHTVVSDTASAITNYLMLNVAAPRP